MPASTAAQWSVKVSQDPMTDEQTAIFLLPASGAEADVLGMRSRSTLAIRCRDRQLEDLYISTPQYLAASDEVTLRFDKDPALTERWSLSTASRALFAPEAADALGALIRSQTFRVAYQPFQSREQVATFAVQQMAAVLPKLNRYCGASGPWSVRAERVALVQWERPASWDSDTTTMPEWRKPAELRATLLRVDSTQVPYAPPVRVDAVPEMGKAIPVTDSLHLKPGRYQLVARLGTRILSPSYPITVVPLEPETAEDLLLKAREREVRANMLGGELARFLNAHMVGKAMCATVVPASPNVLPFRVVAEEGAIHVERSFPPEDFDRLWAARCMKQKDSP